VSALLDQAGDFFKQSLACFHQLHVCHINRFFGLRPGFCSPARVGFSASFGIAHDFPK
jgi:hypothetical protein